METKYLNNLSIARSREIEIMRNTLNKQLKHNQKILTRWKRFENSIKAVSCIILVSSGIIAGITGIGIILTPTISIIIAGCGVGE